MTSSQNWRGYPRIVYSRRENLYRGLDVNAIIARAPIINETVLVHKEDKNLRGVVRRGRASLSPCQMVVSWPGASTCARGTPGVINVNECASRGDENPAELHLFIIS